MSLVSEVLTRTRTQLGLPRMGASIGRVSHMVYHTEAGADMPASASVTQEQRRVLAVHAYHVSLGWQGAGYSYMDFLSGRIYEMRGAGRSGAHTVGYNSTALAVCSAGHGDRTALSQAQIDGRRRLTGALIGDGHMTADPRVTGHRDHSPQSCPGNKAYPQLHLLRGVTGPIGDVPVDPEPPEDDDDPLEDELTVYGPPLTVVRSTDPADGVRKTYLIHNWDGWFRRVKGDGIKVWNDRAEREDQGHVAAVIDGQVRHEVRTDWLYGWFAGMEQKPDVA